MNSNSSDAIPEPYAADPFLCALREVNSTFEGNRQQDAHELLVCILDNIRETCRALSSRAARLQVHENGDTNGLARQPSLEGDNVKPTLSGLRKSWKRRRDTKAPETLPGTQPPTTATPPPESNQDESTRPGWDFVAEDFEGTMVVRTMCLECETVTKRTQAVCDIGVPVSEDGEEDEREPFRSACLSSEYLRDQNKYWCERCLRYNEARRSVAYERLPRLLVLQLKRFSGGMEKITRHAPTPLLLPCFCEPCTRKPSDQSPTHRYILWAVIMHLGQTLSGGHYVAYVRDTAEYTKCERETADIPNNVGSGGFMRTFFNRPRPQPTGCSAKNCCVPRPRPDSCWLACDDELVKPISNEEFEDLLSAEPKMRSAATPYLLFYVKSEVG
ncbi:Ubiquitin carboxyl-terminal hydrolase 1 [Eumeta japonica]|uniref:Ubiquitin carboxyl-terminal hydrolase 1 n=1 Tax=Eumeta variegata TaxID=151549 RepID=A0A4C1X5R5_EUMVA|nr:Ubiquitin carboxyl-terminal hydrolase 1 [Eumeta japonica]